MADLPLPGALRQPGDYDDPDTARRQENQDSLRRDHHRRVEAMLLNSSVGREWVWSLMSKFNVFDLRLAMSGSDFENGVLTADAVTGHRLLATFCLASPENFALMVKENHKPDI